MEIQNSDIDDGYWRIRETAAFLKDTQAHVVAAQFPDSLISKAPLVACRLKAVCREIGHIVDVYVMADTTYNSLSVDEVAAMHVNAECIVHYGRASLTKVSHTKTYYVFPQAENVFNGEKGAHLEALIHEWALKFEESEPTQEKCPAAGNQDNVTHHANLTTGMDASNPHTELVVFIDQVYEYCRDRVESLVSRYVACSVCFPVLDIAGTTASIPNDAAASSSGCCCASRTEVGPRTSTSVPTTIYTRNCAGYIWEQSSSSNTSRYEYVWFGSPDAPALQQLMLTHNMVTWTTIDPLKCTLEHGIPSVVVQTLKRRYFLVEKAREANIVGILVGTLGAAGYKNVIQQLRMAAKNADKKTYTLLMGKPSPAKLANFPEIDIFVLVADPQGHILESKEYLAPIITPYEAMVAFQNDPWNPAEYSLDLVEQTLEGNSHSTEDESSPSNELSLQAQEALTITSVPTGRQLTTVQSSADYFVHRRTWKGVEAPCAGADEKEIIPVQPGQRGRAAVYENEQV